MYIIFGDDPLISQIREKLVVLELETFLTPDQVRKTAYCVVQPNSVFAEMASLTQHCADHQAFVDALNANDFNVALSMAPNMKGKFGGELDSFYQVIQERIIGLHLAETINQ